MKHIYFLLFFVLLTGSCKQEKQEEGEAITIRFDEKESKAPQSLLDIDFIKLETNDDCFIDKTITQIEQASDKLFVLSAGNSRNILVFDTSGKFIAKVGKKGAGPGEYIIPASFSIDNHRKLISVSDLAQQKIIHYRLDNFAFESEEAMKYSNFCFEYLGTDKIVWKNVNYQDEYADRNYILTDLEQNILNTAVHKEFLTGYGSGILKSIYTEDDCVYSYVQYQPFIYCFRGDEVFPAYRLDFGKHKMPSLDYLNRISANNVNFLPEIAQSEYIDNYRVFNTRKALCVYYTATKTDYIGFYDKKKKQTYKYPCSKFQEEMKVGKMERLSGVINNSFVGILQPFDLLEKASENYVFTEKLQQIVSESSEEDNPVLFLFRLK